MQVPQGGLPKQPPVPPEYLALAAAHMNQMGKLPLNPNPPLQSPLGPQGGQQDSL
jgi:hypothetical protein